MPDLYHKIAGPFKRGNRVVVKIKKVDFHV